MPPSPAYNWLCVLCSAANILSHAARHRASQLAPKSAAILPYPNTQPKSSDKIPKKARASVQDPVIFKNTPTTVNRVTLQHENITEDRHANFQPERGLESVSASLSTPEPVVEEQDNATALFAQGEVSIYHQELNDTLTGRYQPHQLKAQAYTPALRNLQSSKVPSSRIGRLFHYGGMLFFLPLWQLPI